MSCKNCKSENIASVCGKCSDCCGFSFNGKEFSGYVPEDVGIGGGDYIEFKYCLDCGTIQGNFPIDTKTMLDKLNAEILEEKTKEFERLYNKYNSRNPYSDRNIDMWLAQKQHMKEQMLELQKEIEELGGSVDDICDNI